jgi:hypothetical protein
MVRTVSKKVLAAIYAMLAPTAFMRIQPDQPRRQRSAIRRFVLSSKWATSSIEPTMSYSLHQSYDGSVFECRVVLYRLPRELPLLLNPLDKVSAYATGTEEPVIPLLSTTGSTKPIMIPN